MWSVMRKQIAQAKNVYLPYNNNNNNNNKLIIVIIIIILTISLFKCQMCLALLNVLIGDTVNE